jgi:hypothetical protein
MTKKERVVVVRLTPEEVGRLLVAVAELASFYADNEGFDVQIAQLRAADRKLRAARAALLSTEGEKKP